LRRDDRCSRAWRENADAVRDAILARRDVRTLIGTAPFHAAKTAQEMAKVARMRAGCAEPAEHAEGARHRAPSATAGVFADFGRVRRARPRQTRMLRTSS
jgi:hypothetical protein